MSNIDPYQTNDHVPPPPPVHDNPRIIEHFGQPRYAYPVQPQQPTSGMAVASMVLGIVGVTVGWFLLGIPAFLAIIFGHIALTEIKKGAKSGKGMAVAGLVLGYIVGSIVVIGILAVAYGA